MLERERENVNISFSILVWNAVESTLCMLLLFKYACILYMFSLLFFVSLFFFLCHLRLSHEIRGQQRDIEIDVFLIVWHFSFDDLFFFSISISFSKGQIRTERMENILINALHIWTCVIVLIFNSHAFVSVLILYFKAFVRNGMCVTLDKWSD